jgi:hypothetical protein
VWMGNWIGYVQCIGAWTCGEVWGWMSGMEEWITE